MSDIPSYLPLLLQGTKVTLELFALTIVLAMPLGLPFALGSNTKILPIKWFCRAYVWIFRGTPLMLQLFFFYFFFPIKLNITLAPFPTVLLTFVLNYAAYYAEIYRGGINSIDHGQYEAAHALGVPRFRTFMDIIMPQTMKAIMPPVVNEAITLVKDTALASTIGAVYDLMKNASSVVNRTTSLMPFAVAAVIYLVLVFVLTLISGRIEKHFARYDAKGEN